MESGSRIGERRIDGGYAGVVYYKRRSREAARKLVA